MASEPPSRRSRRFRLPVPRLWHEGEYALLALFLLIIFGLVAAAFPSVVENFREVTRLYALTPPDTTLKPTHTLIHLDLIDLDEWQGMVTVRVSGANVCRPACTAGTRIVLVAAQRGVLGVAGLPASATVTLPASTSEVTQTVTLPIQGAPLRYPFDTYRLRIGIIPARVAAGGTVRTLTPAEAQGSLAVSLHAHIPGTVMEPPTLLNPSHVPIPDNADRYAVLADLRIQRPLYTRVMAALLVLLVGAAAAYAVFLRPLADLMVNAGGLVLGVWGIRAILAGTERPGSTALDLGLSVVILFLLAGVTARVLLDLGRRGGFSPDRLAARRHAPLGDRGAAHHVAPTAVPPTEGERALARATTGTRSALRTDQPTVQARHESPRRRRSRPRRRTGDLAPPDEVGRGQP